MELVMKQPTSFFETLQKLIPQKGGNIVYEEEKIIEEGFPLSKALEYIAYALGADLRGASLHIIDRFFYPHDIAGDTNDCANTLQNWALKYGISSIILYTNKDADGFPNLCKCAFSTLNDTPSFDIKKYDKTIHDRFWIIKHGETFSGIMVGNSLSGFGNKFTVICKIDENDMASLINILKSYKIFM